MLAMRNKSITFTFVSFVLWATIVYFLIFNQPSKTRQEKPRLALQISNLEVDINQLVTLNKKLFEQIKLRNHRNNVTFADSSVKMKVLNNEGHLDKPENDVVNTLEEKNINISKEWHLPQDATQLQKDSYTQEFHVLPTTHNLKDTMSVIAVLVISCNRITVRRCIDQLLKFRPNAQQFPIIVSQDCSHKETTDVIKSYGNKIIHIQQPDQSDIEVPPREKKFKGYFKIARHYGWALNEIFFKLNFETAIVVEDDLDIAPDFFEYFLGTYPILKSDPSLWCVSAWNDNGKSDLVDLKNPQLLYRTDFFPGLGWMLTRRLWKELSPKWPKSYWDDWIRQPEQRKNRACVRPELSRTRTFGKLGVSNGLFYEKHLQFIKLNEQHVPFTKMNLTYLIKEQYDLSFVNEVYKSEVITYADLKSGNIISQGPVRIPYYTRQMYKSTAKMLGLMDDFKSGVPRTGYRGIVTLFYNGRRVYLAPSASWSGYDISWN